MAALVDVATAVAADLALGPTIDANGVLTSISGQPPRIGHALAVQRLYVPRFNPPSQVDDAYQVIVSPGGEETVRLDRSTLAATYFIEIGVCVKLSAAALTDVALVDAGLQVLQQMGDYFFDYGLSGGAALWVRNDVLAWPDRERLSQDCVLFALWAAAFEGARAK